MEQSAGNRDEINQRRFRVVGILPRSAWDGGEFDPRQIEAAEIESESFRRSFDPACPWKYLWREVHLDSGLPKTPHVHVRYAPRPGHETLPFCFQFDLSSNSIASSVSLVGEVVSSKPIHEQSALTVSVERLWKVVLFVSLTGIALSVAASCLCLRLYRVESRLMFLESEHQTFVGWTEWLSEHQRAVKNEARQ